MYVRCMKLSHCIHQVYYCHKITPTSKPNQVVIIGIIIHSTCYLFSDWPKVYRELWKSMLGHHLAADYTNNNHVKGIQGHW